jgi:hypothetical protein
VNEMSSTAPSMSLRSTQCHADLSTHCSIRPTVRPASADKASQCSLRSRAGRWEQKHSARHGPETRGDDVGTQARLENCAADEARPAVVKRHLPIVLCMQACCAQMQVLCKRARSESE